jgi:NADPH-dependent F420 reductase
MGFVDGRATPRAVEGGSAAQLVQRLLPHARVVATFHHVSARLLARLDRALDEDVLYCADDRDAAQVVAELAEQLEGVRAVSAGPLANAGMLESITPLLLNLNRLHKTNAGLRLTGIKPR